MTKAARKVLADCRVALEMLEEEGDLQRWRIVLVSTLALMRGVANVLETSDCHTAFQRRVFEVMQKEWRSQPEHAIFWQFIMVGRSLVIQDYVPLASPEHEPPLDLDRIEHDTSLKLNWDIFDLRNHVFPSDYRAGEKATKIIAEAIEWWEIQLDVFDAATAGDSADLLQSGLQS
jgi:hypothetical protein